MYLVLVGRDLQSATSNNCGFAIRLIMLLQGIANPLMFSAGL
jgi:hypothetical protein